jgi:hypothetical protein
MFAEEVNFFRDRGWSGSSSLNVHLE